jgi:protein O-GlcNAc transferase
MFAAARRHHQAGRLNDAEPLYRQILQADARHVDALHLLGVVSHQPGRNEAAVELITKAIAGNGEVPAFHNNLGNVLKTQGRLVEALDCYGRALALKPDYAEAHNNRGIVLLEQGKLDEAAAAFECVLAQQPHNAEAHNHLGNVLKEQGKRGQALACYQRALALKPDYAAARLDLAIAVIPVFADSASESSAVAAQFTRSLDELSAWNAAHPGRLGKSVGSNQPFYLAYRPFDVTALLSRYGDVVATAAADFWQPLMGNKRRVQPRRDRIGIAVVSGQVRQHPVWDVVLRGIIEHIDRRQFEIFLYHTGAITDAQTLRSRNQVDRFVQGPKPTRGWLDEIAQDRPDVMFYPELGMDAATCALAALRLAPLQVAGWGHPVTTGLPSMDLFLSAELLEAGGADRHYREQLVRLPGTGVCTESTAETAQGWGGPARPHNAVRFALCQQPIKFDPADDVLLARIARAAGASEFWLASPAKLRWATARLRDRLALALRAQGLDPDAHLRVMPWLAREHFLGFLDEMDICLDCPAFSGYTTAWQAAHRGLPLVTLEGEFLRQRLAAGLLRQIGVTDGIAQSREQYVELAVRWLQQCREPAQWAARRAALRQAAPLADGNRAAVTALERALIEALQAQRASLDHPQ